MASKLDGPGTAKMATLDDATVALQRLHGLVERMAVAVKSGEGSQLYGSQIKRFGGPLVGQLKGQFGTIADQVTKLLLDASRGGNEQLKVRSLREGVAQIRTALDIAASKVKEKHMTEDDDAESSAPSSGNP